MPVTGVAGTTDLLTNMSGESPISPKLLLIDVSPGFSTMPSIAEGVVVLAVAVVLAAVGFRVAFFLAVGVAAVLVAADFVAVVRVFYR